MIHSSPKNSPSFSSRITPFFHSAISIAASVALSLTSAAFAQPTITGINNLPGRFGNTATGISADGAAVTGQAYGGTGGTSFRWTRSGGVVNIGGLPGGTSGIGTGLSGDGSVVTGWEASGTARAFRWTSGGGFQNIGVLPGGTGASANGINGDGTAIVGRSGSPSGTRAFRWTSAGMVNLGTLPGGSAGSSEALAISTDGSAIAGVSATPTRDRAFRWTSGGGMENLGVLPGHASSIAFAISGNGAVVAGVSNPPPSPSFPLGSTAFRWTSSGGMQGLGILTGFDFSETSGVNGDGSAIVGGCGSNSGGVAFLWTPALGMVDLNTYLPTLGLNLAGWRLDRAAAISSNGSVITGNGTFNGQDRVWVVSGIPTPGASPVCLADVVRDNVVDGNDFITFINSFSAGDVTIDAAADVAGGGASGLAPDGIIDGSDFVAFINAFSAGC